MKPLSCPVLPTLVLPVALLLAGCQSAPGAARANATPGPASRLAAGAPPGPASAARPDIADLPEVQEILARLGPAPKVVSVIANGSESWEQVGGRLQQACRERYPTLGPAPVVTVVDRREVTREVALPVPGFGQHSPGGAGMQLLATPVPVTTFRPRLVLKKALARCAAPA